MKINILKTIRLLGKKISDSKNIGSLLIFGVTLVIYIKNLSPSVYAGDSGDLISAIITRGVPHPSGYPLYTILGIIFSNIPFDIPIAWKIGLLSSILSSLSAVIAFLIIKLLCKNSFLSFLSTLILATSYPVWLFAEVAEVFALHIFLLLLVILSEIKFLETKKKKYIYLIALLFGLALSNNLTSILLAPSILLTIFMGDKSLFLNFKTILKSIFLFIAGLLPYLYIPLSVSKNLFYSWGYGVNLNNIISIIFRKEYGWGLTSYEYFNKDFLMSLVNNYLYYWELHVNLLITILIIIGLIMSLVKFRKEAIIILTSYIFFGPIFLLYSRNPISSFSVLSIHEKFYTSGIVLLYLFIPIGFSAILRLVKVLPIRDVFGSATQNLLYISLIIIFFAAFTVNDKKLNFSHIYIGDNFALDILNSLNYGSFAMLTGDSKVFNSYYAQYALNIRRDVYIPGRPDSFKFLITPTLEKESDFNEYATIRGGTIDRETYVNALSILLEKKDVYTDHTIENMQIVHKDYGKVIFVPFGLVNKVYFEKKFNLSKDEYIKTVNDITSMYQLSDLTNNEYLVKSNLSFNDIQFHYSSAFYSIADFLANYYQDTEAALPFLLKSIALDPMATD
ncbi:MAG TPA: DUF2723 domain-containing protein [Patescibacteria group bacterium]|nr:DUF2723 domain-containing protein [Patescibacteria group bacterium]